mgnify:CR=1 FL=1
MPARTVRLRRVWLLMALALGIGLVAGAVALMLGELAFRLRHDVVGHVLVGHVADRVRAETGHGRCASRWRLR